MVNNPLIRISSTALLVSRNTINDNDDGGGYDADADDDGDDDDDDDDDDQCLNGRK